MKTICQKSGVPIWKSNYLLGFDLEDEHPIFRAKSKLILTPEMVHRFMKAESEEEKRLIYLAVFNTSNLVIWNHPAAPSKRTMESTFYRLLELAQWVRFAEFKLAKIIAFPQFIVSKETYTLESVSAWMEAINDIRVKLNRKELDRDKNAALLARELEIKRELNIANSVGAAFTPSLAKWALDLCDITIRNPDYNRLMKIMCCKIEEAWIVELSDLMEVRDMLHNNLPFLEENPQAISVIHQINLLIKANRRGFTDLTFFGKDNLTEVDTFEILEDGVEVKKIVKINKQLIDIPSDKPDPKSYPNRFAYLQANAKWELAQAAKKIEDAKNLDKGIDEDLI